MLYSKRGNVILVFWRHRGRADGLHFHSRRGIKRKQKIWQLSFPETVSDFQVRAGAKRACCNSSAAVSVCEARHTLQTKMASVQKKLLPLFCRGLGMFTISARTTGLSESFQNHTFILFSLTVMYSYYWRKTQPLCVYVHMLLRDDCFLPPLPRTACHHSVSVTDQFIVNNHCFGKAYFSKWSKVNTD